MTNRALRRTSAEYEVELPDGTTAKRKTFSTDAEVAVAMIYKSAFDDKWRVACVRDDPKNKAGWLATMAYRISP